MTAEAYHILRLVTLLVALSGAVGRSSEAAALVDFSMGGPAEFLAEELGDRVRVQEKALVIIDASARLRDLKIRPATKYTLSLEASFEGDAESIEENPRFEIFNQPGQPNPRLPSHEIRFFDKAGEPVGQPFIYAQPFRRQHSYQNIFYSPSDAATARISLASGKGLHATVTQLRLAETADEGALNPNPAFSLGRFNYSGWKNIADGGELIERDGKAILDTKYGSTGMTIPLTTHGTYAFSAKATPNGYNSTVIIRIYDAKGNELMRSGTRIYGPLNYFVPPKEAVSASFLVYSCLLEEVRLIRVGDEDAIESLRGQ